MAGLAKNTAKKVVKHKKHGKKKFVRPSQKKSVKNGRHQEKETPKKKVAKAVNAIPAGLDGAITDDEIDEVALSDYDSPEYPEPFEEMEPASFDDMGPETVGDDSDEYLDSLDDPHE